MSLRKKSFLLIIFISLLLNQKADFIYCYLMQNNQQTPYYKASLMSQPISQDSSVLKQIVQEIFAKRDLMIFDYLRILEKHRKISYVSFQQFIEQFQQSKQKTIRQCGQALAKDFDEHRALHGDINWVFPRINIPMDSLLEETLKSKFSSMYMAENQKSDKQTNIKTSQNKESQKDKSSQQDQDSDGSSQKDKDEESSSSDEDQLYEIQQGELLLMQAQFFEPKLRPKVTDSQQQQCIYNKRGNFACKQVKALIPQFFFFTRNGEERVSTSYLISIDTTSLYKEELNQVKTLIKSQIERNSFVKNSLQEFYDEYILFNLIINDQSFADNTNLKLLSFYRRGYMKNIFKKAYLFKQNQSPILKFWNKVYKQANNIIQQQVHPKNIRQYLIEMLQSIYLVFQPKSQAYAFNNNKQIVINVSSQNLPFYEFKRSILKPYLMVCIYHQFGHKLARCGEQSEMGNLSQSFTFNNNTVGCKILQIIHDNAEGINKFFKKHKFQFNKQYNIAKINRMVSEGRKFLQQYKNIFDQIKKSSRDLVNIKKTIQALSSIGRICDMKQIQKALCSLWQQLKDLDSQQKTEHKIKQISMSKIQKQKLEFIHALILMKFVSNLQNKKGSIFYQKLRLFFQKGPSFSLKQIEIILKLVTWIKKNQTDFFSDEEAIIFYKFYLQSSKPFNILQENIKKLFSKFRRLNFSNFLKKALSLNISLGYRQIDHADVPQLQKQSIEKLSQINFIKKTYNKLAKFLKRSDLYIISCTAPSFIFQGISLQSGLQIELKMYPTLYQNKYVFGQDYQIMKELSQKNKSKVGKTPSTSKMKLLNKFVGKNSENRIPHIDLPSRRCNMRLHLEEEE